MSEKIRHHEEDEAPERSINYADIERELQPSGILIKYYGPSDAATGIRGIELDQAVRDKLLHGPYSLRDQDHLIRLLQHGGVEAIFATEYIQHANSVMSKDKDQARAIERVIMSEGADTQTFWTFAPYLFQALTEKGIVANKAIAMILNWSKDGVSVSKNKPGEDWGSVHLKGLEFLNQHHKDTYILSEDPNHVSHKFTAQESQRIADLLIAENDET